MHATHTSVNLLVRLYDTVLLTLQFKLFSMNHQKQHIYNAISFSLVQNTIKHGMQYSYLFHV